MEHRGPLTDIEEQYQSLEAQKYDLAQLEAAREAFRGHITRDEQMIGVLSTVALASDVVPLIDTVRRIRTNRRG